MTKHLTAIGNSLGLIIEKPILELLKIDRDTQLEVTTDGHGLYIRPIGDKHLPKPFLPPRPANDDQHDLASDSA